MLHCNIVAMHNNPFKLNVRRKAMSTAIYENISKVGKSSYEAIKELYTINSNLAEQLAEQQLALVTLGVEFSASQLKLASEAKGYKEIISGQTEIATDVSSKVQGIARNTMDIMNETKNQITAWFEKGVKEAAKVVPLTSKVA